MADSGVSSEPKAIDFESQSAKKFVTLTEMFVTLVTRDTVFESQGVTRSHKEF